MNRRGWAAVAVALAGLPLAAHAAPPDEDKDLALIPPATQAPAPAPGLAPGATGGGRPAVYLEDAASAAATRGGLAVPPPAGPSSPWVERLFLDDRGAWRLQPRLSLAFSGRVNLRAEEDIAFPSRQNARLDLRELYLSWSPADGVFLDAGRINLKSGVALGYNPTDVFKTRAVVEVLSSDPSVLREDRLGALMLRGQWVGPALSVTAAFAPKLYRPTAIYSNLRLPSLDPMLDRTNAQDRLLLKANVKLGEDFSPEVMVYREGERTRLGFNLTESVGRSLVLYAEWAGGERTSLVDEARAYGRQTGTLPATAPSALPDDPRRRFMNDLSAGLSYTTVSKIVFNLEYHLHQSGFSRDDWRRWFAVGAARGPGPVAAQLWYIRGYAADQQEPASRQTAFLRVDRQDAFVRDLELSGFVNLDLEDGSGLTQVAADYFLSDAWTIGALATASFGARRSDFGGSPQAGSVLVKLARYF